MSLPHEPEHLQPGERWVGPLSRFLESAFSNMELYQFFIEHISRDLANSIGDTTLPRKTYCFQSVEALIRLYGHAPSTFKPVFDRLRDERPLRSIEIDGIALLMTPAAHERAAQLETVAPFAEPTAAPPPSPGPETYVDPANHEVTAQDRPPEPASPIVETPPAQESADDDATYHFEVIPAEPSFAPLHASMDRPREPDAGVHEPPPATARPSTAPERANLDRAQADPPSQPDVASAPAPKRPRLLDSPLLRRTLGVFPGLHLIAPLILLWFSSTESNQTLHEWGLLWCAGYIPLLVASRWDPGEPGWDHWGNGGGPGCMLALVLLLLVLIVLFPLYIIVAPAVSVGSHPGVLGVLRSLVAQTLNPNAQLARVLLPLFVCTAVTLHLPGRKEALVTGLCRAIHGIHFAVTTIVCFVALLAGIWHWAERGPLIFLLWLLAIAALFASMAVIIEDDKPWRENWIIIYVLGLGFLLLMLGITG